MLLLRLPSLCLHSICSRLSSLGFAGRLSAGMLLLAALLIGSGLLGAGSAHAQDPVSTLEDTDGEEVMQIFENGDLTLFQNGALTVPGIIETTGGGLVLPDGTTLGSASDLGQLSLPFSGSESEDGPLFELENTGSGPAIQASAGDIVASSGAFVLSDGTRLQGSGDLGGIPTTESGAFDLSNDEGIVAGGTFDSGPIPAEGAGTRMMWYPEKAAFRAGRVFDTPTNEGSQFWDASNVGAYSLAFGLNTKASSDGATALSWETTASGKYATAMGLQTSAEGPATLAIGDETTASGGAATAMGNQTTASGSNATAMGSHTTAATRRSLSIGKCNSANTSADGTLFVVGNGTAPGRSCDSRQDALMLDQDGNLTIAGNLSAGNLSISGSFSMGFLSTASGDDSAALGNRTTASGGAATAMGTQTTASGRDATAMGQRTTASGDRATAMGFFTTASGTNATAMGVQTTAATERSLSIGECNSANNFTADNTLLVVGNGDITQAGRACLRRRDALVLDTGGNLEISGTLTEDSDRRLKTSIEPLGPGVLHKLASLRPVRYRFKDQRTHPSGKQIGLIAQEVRKEFPSLVRESSDGMLSLAYSKLTAVLVKGIQEQQSTIDRQGERISKLEAENEEIKKRLAALEAQSTGPLPAGLPRPGLLIGLLLGGLLGAAFFWRRK